MTWARSGRRIAHVLRALRLAQTKARTPTFPALFEAEPGRARSLDSAQGPAAGGSVPNFHALRHTAASEAIASGESVEQVAWMLGHRDSVVTKQVYVHELQTEDRRSRRRALLEARYGEALVEAAERSRLQQTPLASLAPAGELVDLRGVRDKAQ